MKIKTIEIERGVTINMGDYESAKFSVALGATLGPSDDVAISVDELNDEVVHQLKLLIAGSLTKRKAAIAIKTLGLEDGESE